MTAIRSPVSIADFVIYETSTGRVLRNGRVMVKDLALQPLEAGEAMVEGKADLNASYIDLAGTAPQIKSRPTLAGFPRLTIKADSTDKITMALPVAATIWLDGHRQDVPAEDLDFTADSPGNYRIEIDAFPFLLYAVTVAAQ